jgi:hypothetical protein
LLPLIATHNQFRLREVFDTANVIEVEVGKYDFSNVVRAVTKSAKILGYGIVRSYVKAKNFSQEISTDRAGNVAGVSGYGGIEPSIEQHQTILMVNYEYIDWNLDPTPGRQRPQHLRQTHTVPMFLVLFARPCRKSSNGFDS